MKKSDTPCPHPSIVQFDQGDKITTQCTKCGKKINVRQKSDTDTPRTDEQIWTTDFDHKPCDVVDMPFARELEQELAASQAEVERLNQWKDNLISNLMALEIYEHKHENDPAVALAAYGQWQWSAGEWEKQAEVERLQNGFQGSCYCCEPVGEMNQKLEAEVEKLKTEYWFMEEALNKEIATLKEQRDKAIEIADKIWADCSNGSEHTDLAALKSEIK